MKFDFSDQVIMITGASGNLGLAVGRLFAAAGGRLALIDRQPARISALFADLAGDDRRLLVRAADLLDETSVAQAVQSFVDHFGHIDVLVNTVGGYRAGKPLHETELPTLEFLLRLNTYPVLISNKAVLPHMLARGTGKIINVAAKSALGAHPRGAAYSAAKAAVVRLTESSAMEVRHKGINVNCVLPSTIDTPQNRAAMPDADFSKWVTPESLAQVIAFLCSTAARDVHGVALPVIGQV